MKKPVLQTLLLLALLPFGSNAFAQLNIAKELDLMEGYIAQRDVISPEVSAVDVAWHLDHSMKVVLKLYQALKYSDPAAHRSAFKPVRSLVFTTGRMPRGVGKAPKSVLPPENIVTEDIVRQLNEVRALLTKFPELDAKQHFEHPVFGVLKRKRAMRFLRIHTRHHLRIIEDIVRENPAAAR